MPALLIWLDLARYDDSREIDFCRFVASKAIRIDNTVFVLAVCTHVCKEARVAYLFVRRAVVTEIVTSAWSTKVGIPADWGRKLVGRVGAVVVAGDGS
jgi:hypothetical protein